ncbi:PIN domain-containing protein [bacterium]|nr:PIN domain-containing protein [bacterium]
MRDNAEYHAFSSVITLTEVLTFPLKKMMGDIANKYKEFLLYSNNFTVYPIDSQVAEKAAEIKGHYDIKTPDAIQVATAIGNNGTLFITNDKNLKKIDKVKVLTIEDLM